MGFGFFFLIFFTCIRTILSPSTARKTTASSASPRSRRDSAPPSASAVSPGSASVRHLIRPPPRRPLSPLRRRMIAFWQAMCHLWLPHHGHPHPLSPATPAPVTLLTITYNGQTAATTSTSHGRSQATRISPPCPVMTAVMATTWPVWRRKRDTPCIGASNGATTTTKYVTIDAHLFSAPSPSNRSKTFRKNFQNIPKNFQKFSEIFKNFQKFSKKSFKKFQKKVPKNSKKFQTNFKKKFFKKFQKKFQKFREKCEKCVKRNLKCEDFHKAIMRKIGKKRLKIDRFSELILKVIWKNLKFSWKNIFRKIVNFCF